MVFKLAHEREIHSIPIPVEGKLYDDLFQFLIVLDSEYGEDRDVEHDDGGFVLFCTPGTEEEEVAAFFDCARYTPEWTIRIEHEPEYCATLYIPRDEYAVVLILASVDAPKEIIAAMESEEKA